MRDCGTSQRGVAAKTWSEVTHPDDLLPDVTEFNKLLSGEKDLYALDKRFIRQDGSVSHAHIVAQAIRREDGTIDHFLALVQDINEKKQIEEKLQAERQQMLALFDGIDEPVYVADPETYELLYTNHSFKQIWSSQPVGKKCYEVLQNLTGPCDFCTNPHIFGENVGQTYTWELQNRVTKRWYLCSDKAIRWSDGRWVRFELATDITVKKEAELLLALQRDLAQQLSQVRSLADAVETILSNVMQLEEIDSGGLYLVDPVSGDLNLVGARGFPTLFLQKTATYPADSPQSRLIQSGQSTYTNVSELNESLQVTILAQEGIQAIAVIPIHHNGQTIASLNIGSHRYGAFSENTRKMIETVAARIGSFLINIQDQEALAALTQQLQASNDELKQFAYIASHDLQEPLRTVSSYLQLLQRFYQDELDVRANEFIEFAVGGAMRMNSLINDLLLFSRLATQAHEFKLTDLNEVLKNVLKDLELVIAEKNCQIRSERLPVAMADATQMQQLLQNLISNALKFHGERPPEVHLGVQEEPREWVIWVRDNGIGIAPRYQERIFEIFKRLHTQSEYPGTGIGLAVCKRIVEQHNGRIWVDSDGQTGTTFYFALPK
ncbi:MAG: ATP-binding protein [Chloroflexota bacterium]